MTDSENHSRAVNLTEYEQLRNEINNRTRLSAGLVALQLAALGAGLSVVNKLHDVVLALAAVSSLLWLLWIDHSSQIYKIGAYIGLRLAPRFRDSNAELLGWENFVRALDQGGQKTADALGDSDSNEPVLRTGTVGRYISLLFGGTPLLLIAGYVVGEYKDLFECKAILSLHGLVLGLASIALTYAGFQYWRFVKMRRRIDKALLPKEQSNTQVGN